MPEENKEQGESMEGILKSIKNIISGELDKNGKTAMEDNNPTKADGDEEVLELTNKVSGPTVAPNFETKNKTPAPAAAEIEQHARDVLKNIDQALGQSKKDGAQATTAEFAKKDAPSASVASFAKEEAPEAKEVKSNAEEKESMTTLNQKKSDNDALLSEQSAKRSEEALKSLLKSVPKPQIDSPSFRSGQTLEDLVVESLRPIMAEWLNQNLPTIVQTMVEKEIRKIMPKD